MDLDVQTAARAFGAAYFNLLRRGDDGSLVLSTDRWRLLLVDDEGFRFAAEDPAAEDLLVRHGDIARLSWDQVGRQQLRSQIRFHLVSGSVWSFSGQVDERALKG